MTDAQIVRLAEGIASMLVSLAAHGLATSALDGIGEITLRDGLIVAAAAVAAEMRQAWMLEREVVPSGWNEGPVDLMLYRVGNQSSTTLIGGVELKWWRRTDGANSANRRRDLLRDFIRAASLYPIASDFAFVALLATSKSWNSTVVTRGKDEPAMAMLSASGFQRWNMTALSQCPGIRGALRSLRGTLNPPNIFHTDLISTRLITDGSSVLAAARIWKVKKPQKTILLSDAQVDDLLR